MTTRQTVTINGPEDRQRIATWARNVEVGTVVTFRKKSRSTEQSAKMWAMLHEVAEQVEWYGQKLDAEDWKDMFTASLRHARVVPGVDKGTFVPLGMHTSTMTIEEMSNLIELIYAFGAEHGVKFKDTPAAPPAADVEGGGAPHDDPASTLPQSADDAAAEEGEDPGAVTTEQPAPSSAVLSDDDRKSLAYLIKRLAASVGPEESVVVATAKGVAAEERAMGDLAKKKAQTIVQQFRAVCRDEIEKGDAIEYACGIAGIDPKDVEGAE